VLDAMIWLVVIPSVIMAIRFWLKVAQWALRNKRTLGQRVQRVRSAFVEASRGEE
jgi:hypothetical protein